MAGVMPGPRPQGAPAAAPGARVAAQAARGADARQAIEADAEATAVPVSIYGHANEDFDDLNFDEVDDAWWFVDDEPNRRAVNVGSVHRRAAIEFRPTSPGVVVARTRSVAAGVPDHDLSLFSHQDKVDGFAEALSELQPEAVASRSLVEAFAKLRAVNKTDVENHLRRSFDLEEVEQPSGLITAQWRLAVSGPFGQLVSADFFVTSNDEKTRSLTAAYVDQLGRNHGDSKAAWKATKEWTGQRAPNRRVPFTVDSLLADQLLLEDFQIAYERGEDLADAWSRYLDQEGNRSTSGTPRVARAAFEFALFGGLEPLLASAWARSSQT